jgi:Caspase domain
MRRPALCNLLSLAALLLLPALTISSAVASESRVALVIGQSAYRAVPALPNASNDAKRMSELLSSAGFDVTAAPDLSQGARRSAASQTR